MIAVGRKDEARKVLAKYHGNGDPDAPLVLLEWKEFEESVRLDASDKRWSVSCYKIIFIRLLTFLFARWDYTELFNSRNARYRTSMMLLMGFFGVTILSIYCNCYSGSKLFYAFRSNGQEMVWGKVI